MVAARYEPTPEEIREACLDLQDTWSPEEEYRRRVYKGGIFVEVREAKEMQRSQVSMKTDN